MRAPELRRIRQEINDGPLSIRCARAGFWVPVLKKSVTHLKTQRQQVCSRFRQALETRIGVEVAASETPHVDSEDRRKALVVGLSAVAALSIELIMAVAIGVLRLALAPLLAGILSGLIAAFLTTTGLGVHYGTSDSEFPAAARRRARIGTIVTFAASLLAVLPLLFARTVPEIASWVGVATGVVSISVSSLSSYLFFLMLVHSWAVPYTKEYNGLEGEIAMTEQLLTEAADVAGGRYPLRLVGEARLGGTA